MCISRSSALATRFPDLIRSAWPASAHTSALQRHDHPLVPLLRPSTAVATAVHGTSTLRAGSSHDRSVQPPSPACTAATPWPSPGRWLERAPPVPGVNWYGARRHGDPLGTAPVADPGHLRSSTAWRCAVPWPPPADGGSN